jgi:uncharacterized protein YbjT (DUF2867 family)
VRAIAPRRVLVAGATGLVGGEILAGLVADEGVAEVRVLVRRPLDRGALTPKVRELVADFDALDANPDWFRVDQVLCALGTTIRKAGSRDAFRRVDFDYPFAVARLAHAQGARHFLLVSSAGADARSRVFYSRVKGELEDAVRAVGFTALTIARPSVLIGPREERRAGELVLKRLAPLFPGAWKPVHAKQVASALVRAARDGTPGVAILDNAALRREHGRVP